MEIKTHKVHTTLEGDGFEVQRPFPVAGLSYIDPFLLIDQLGPKMVIPGTEIGTPWHPHRGFETVTYIISGSGNHRDTMGNHGTLAPGDVQWMTAGSGVLHKEGPDPDAPHGDSEEESFAVQLWVNLPANKKMIDPQYQDVRGNTMPNTHLSNYHIKLVAGTNIFELDATTQTQTPITYAHIHSDPSITVAENPANTTIDPKHNVIINPLVGKISGKIRDAQTQQEHNFEVEHGNIISFSGADHITFDVAENQERVDVLLLTGEPLNEPVARYGPFVMNNDDELAQAFSDFRSGAMGQIPTGQ